MVPLRLFAPHAHDAVARFAAHCFLPALPATVKALQDEPAYVETLEYEMVRYVNDRPPGSV